MQPHLSFSTTGIVLLCLFSHLFSIFSGTKTVSPPYRHSDPCSGGKHVLTNTVTTCNAHLFSYLGTYCNIDTKERFRINMGELII